MTDDATAGIEEHHIRLDLQASRCRIDRLYGFGFRASDVAGRIHRTGWRSQS